MLPHGTTPRPPAHRRLWTSFRRRPRWQQIAVGCLAAVVTIGPFTSTPSEPTNTRDGGRAAPPAAPTSNTRLDASSAAAPVSAGTGPAPDTTAGTTPSNTGVAVAGGSTSPEPDAPAPSGASGDTYTLLATITVEPEPARIGYDRDLFDHWVDTNGSGCTTRQDVLAAQIVGLPQTDPFDRCTIVEGDWYSVYDAVTHSGSPSELDVDHVVALAEAWDSGAGGWDDTTRRQFANDPMHLIAVTASSNRAKSDEDLGEWRPPQRSAWCLTATITVRTKAAYQLTIDATERAAIADMLTTCGQPDQLTVAGIDITGAVTPIAVPAPTTPPSTGTPTPPAPQPAPAPAADGCVNINTATSADLQRIIHIGTDRADALVALRPFSSVSDLDRIKGIGPARLRDIQAQGIACV